jgi:hypothetical protein
MQIVEQYIIKEAKTCIQKRLNQGYTVVAMTSTFDDNQWSTVLVVYNLPKE